MNYQSRNPFTGQELKNYSFESFTGTDTAWNAFRIWKNKSISERSACFERLGASMSDQKMDLARLITTEMGKPLSESVLEIKKSISAINYYRENAEAFLKQESVKTEASESYISFEPLGLIFLIMPWNFPFWQVFRCAVPALFAGNGILLKHAPNVPQCAEKIESLFLSAGFPAGLFSNHFLSNESAAELIADPRIAGLSFTGSDTTGSYLAAISGKHLKKTVMELGGNDPFIVLDDANIELALNAAIRSRSINGGQACNAAKRFIVTEKVANDFSARLIAAVQQLKVGDPMDSTTDIGPMARKDLADKVKSQIEDSIKEGATAHYGMKGPQGHENFVQPIVLTGVGKNTRAYQEEVFGPVWSIVMVKDEMEAIRVANDSMYGLGASLWTSDIRKAKEIIPQLETGNVFVNDFVRSDPALPFGGVKRSGFGRELSTVGMMEFVNVKTVFVR
ncbi:MAG: NAD-dependent succinate-semialdehyde dehydrogenase [Bacteroidetes bacterium]|nr:NAD-dependent succinate-semialdehyde dehydrogenase [Bacteroidota bacterium]